MTSGRQIVRASLEDLHAVADERVPRVTCQVFDASDGLPEAEFTRGRQPASTKDKHGDLWFATTQGLVKVEPGALQLNDQVPPVHVTEVSYYHRASLMTSTLAGGQPSRFGRKCRPICRQVALPAGVTTLKSDTQARA
jgi:hypothetical protein